VTPKKPKTSRTSPVRKIEALADDPPSVVVAPPTTENKPLTIKKSVDYGLNDDLEAFFSSLDNEL